MWVRLTCRVILLCMFVLHGNAIFAQSGSASDPVALNLDTAIARTLEGNPRLIAYGYQIDAQRGRHQQAELKPNLLLGIEVENAVGTGDYQGIDSAETTLSLAWVLERGKRERRMDAANAGVHLLEAEAEIHRLDAAAETARAYLDTLALQERLIQTDAAVTLAEQIAAAVQNQVNAGRTPAADLARAEAELASMRLDREDIEHELRTSHRRLAAQWGDVEPDFARVIGDLDKLPTPDSYAKLLARLEQNPDLSRYLSEKRLREAELRLAEAQAKPDWQVFAGVRRLERTDDEAFLAGITIPLTTRNRNQGRISEARARLAMTDADRAATRTQIETQLFSLYQELQHSLHRTTTLREEILPRFEQALKDTEHAYAAGRYGYFELRVVQAELLGARTALVESSVAAHRQIIEIERLTGTTLVSAVSYP